MQQNHIFKHTRTHGTMLKEYIRWLACLGGWSKNPPDGRTITSRKDPTGSAVLQRSLTTNRGKTVNFTMSKHHESCTNATGLENGEPGRLNRRNRAYGREDMAVRSIAGKTGLSGERSHYRTFGSEREKAYSAQYAFKRRKRLSASSRQKYAFPLWKRIFSSASTEIRLHRGKAYSSKYAFAGQRRARGWGR